MPHLNLRRSSKFECILHSRLSPPSRSSETRFQTYNSIRCGPNSNLRLSDGRSRPVDRRRAGPLVPQAVPVPSGTEGGRPDSRRLPTAQNHVPYSSAAATASSSTSDSDSASIAAILRGRVHSSACASIHIYTRSEIATQSQLPAALRTVYGGRAAGQGEAQVRAQVTVTLHANAMARA